MDFERRRPVLDPAVFPDGITAPKRGCRMHRQGRAGAKRTPPRPNRENRAVSFLLLDNQSREAGNQCAPPTPRVLRQIRLNTGLLEEGSYVPTILQRNLR
jgi:hypothetical protein